MYYTHIDKETIYSNRKHKGKWSNPFKQEVPYGTRCMIDGVEYVYIPDPWTFPEGYGNAWCSVTQLEKEGILIRNE